MELDFTVPDDATDVEIERHAMRLMVDLSGRILDRAWTWKRCKTGEGPCLN